MAYPEASKSRIVRTPVRVTFPKRSGETNQEGRKRRKKKATEWLDSESAASLAGTRPSPTLDTESISINFPSGKTLYQNVPLDEVLDRETKKALKKKKRKKIGVTKEVESAMKGG